MPYGPATASTENGDRPPASLHGEGAAGALVTQVLGRVIQQHADVRVVLEVAVPMHLHVAVRLLVAGVLRLPWAY